MADLRIPDPTLLSRLEASGRDIEWAVSRVAPWQHDAVDDLWPAHQQLAHLLAVETENFQPRIRRILNEESPILESWDTEAFNARYTVEGDIADLAASFAAERATTVASLKGLQPEHWSRSGIWPDGETIDLAWLAEKALWHSLDHLAMLIDIHGDRARRQAS